MPRAIVFALNLFLLFNLSGCARPDSHPSPGVPVPEDLSNTRAPVVRASLYGEKRAVPILEPAEDALFHRAIDAAGRPLCTVDAALVDGARLHMADLHSGAVGEGVDAMDYLRFSLHFAGAPDYVVTPFRIEPGLEGLAAFDRFIAAHAEDWTHCGVGVADADPEGGALWIGVRRSMLITPVPVKLERGARTSIGFQNLETTRTGIEAYLEFPDGRVEELRIMALAGGRYSLIVSLSDPGRYSLEILTDTGDGFETAMLLPLHVEMEPENRPTVLPVSEEPAGDPVESLLDLINRVRARVGVGPLQRDPRLDAVASEHCRDMARSNTFGHYSAQTGTLLDRLRARKLEPSLIAENIARSKSLFRAHANLMKSPSHKMRLLKREFTHMGAGVIPVKNDVLITEVFVRW